MPALNAVNLITAFVFLIIVCSIFSYRLAEKLQKALAAHPLLVIYASVALFAWYGLYAMASGIGEPFQAGKVFCYFLLTAAFGWRFIKPDASGMRWYDAVLILGFWIPVDAGLFRRTPPLSPKTLEYSLTLASAVCIAVLVFRHLRKLEGMKLEWRRDPGDITRTLLGVLGLVAVLLPLGLCIRFLPPQDFLLNAGSFWQAAGEIFRRLLAPAFWGMVVLKSLGTGLPEELLFRGITQNLLEKRLQRKQIALFATSFLFGLAHLYKPIGSIHPELWKPETWNFSYMLMASVAGIGYGWLFRKTRSILFPATVHGFIDIAWGTFFVT